MNATLTCSAGYYASPLASVTCSQSTLAWAPSQPTCIRKLKRLTCYVYRFEMVSNFLGIPTTTVTLFLTSTTKSTTSTILISTTPYTITATKLASTVLFTLSDISQSVTGLVTAKFSSSKPNQSSVISPSLPSYGQTFQESSTTLPTSTTLSTLGSSDFISPSKSQAQSTYYPTSVMHTDTTYATTVVEPIVSSNTTSLTPGTSLITTSSSMKTSTANQTMTFSSHDYVSSTIMISSSDASSSSITTSQESTSDIIAPSSTLLLSGSSFPNFYETSSPLLTSKTTTNSTKFNQYITDAESTLVSKLSSTVTYSGGFITSSTIMSTTTSDTVSQSTVFYSSSENYIPTNPLINKSIFSKDEMISSIKLETNVQPISNLIGDTTTASETLPKSSSSTGEKFTGVGSLETSVVNTVSLLSTKETISNQDSPVTKSFIYYDKDTSTETVSYKYTSETLNVLTITSGQHFLTVAPESVTPLTFTTPLIKDTTVMAISPSTQSESKHTTVLPTETSTSTEMESMSITESITGGEKETKTSTQYWTDKNKQSTTAIGQSSIIVSDVSTVSTITNFEYSLNSLVHSSESVEETTPFTITDTFIKSEEKINASSASTESGYFSSDITWPSSVSIQNISTTGFHSGSTIVSDHSILSDQASQNILTTNIEEVTEPALNSVTTVTDINSETSSNALKTSTILSSSETTVKDIIFETSSKASKTLISVLSSSELVAQSTMAAETPYIPPKMSETDILTTDTISTLKMTDSDEKINMYDSTTSFSEILTEATQTDDIPLETTLIPIFTLSDLIMSKMSSTLEQETVESSGVPQETGSNSFFGDETGVNETSPNTIQNIYDSTIKVESTNKFHTTIKENTVDLSTHLYNKSDETSPISNINLETLSSIPDPTENLLTVTIIQSSDEESSLSEFSTPEESSRPSFENSVIFSTKQELSTEYLMSENMELTTVANSDQYTAETTHEKTMKPYDTTENTLTNELELSFITPETMFITLTSLATITSVTTENEQNTELSSQLNFQKHSISDAKETSSAFVDTSSWSSNLQHVYNLILLFSVILVDYFYSLDIRSNQIC